MLYSGPGADEVTDEHEGFVAGRLADGALTDIWTDVTAAPAGTYSAYLAACECGWTGSARHAVNPQGYDAAQRAWLAGHFRPLLGRHLVGLIAARQDLPAEGHFLRSTPAG